MSTPTATIRPDRLRPECFGVRPNIQVAAEHRNGASGEREAAADYLAWLFADVTTAGLSAGSSVPGPWPSLVVTPSSSGSGWRLQPDGRRHLRSLSELGAEVVRGVHTVVRESAQVPLLHAGGIVGSAGVVLLAGRSGAGKSTLVAACGREGLGVQGDELVALDGTGRHTHGCGMPVNLKPGSRQVLQWLDRDGPVPISHLGAVAMTGPARVAGVVLLAPWRHGAGQLGEISRRDAALSLAQLAIPPGGHDRRMLHLMADLVAGVPCYAMRSGSLVDRVRTVRDLADGV